MAVILVFFLLLYDDLLSFLCHLGILTLDGHSNLLSLKIEEKS